jgi:hypothetical protein
LAKGGARKVRDANLEECSVLLHADTHLLPKAVIAFLYIGVLSERTNS